MLGVVVVREWGLILIGLYGTRRFPFSHFRRISVFLSCRRRRRLLPFACFVADSYFARLDRTLPHRTS